MRLYGLKVWSVNEQYLEQACRLVREGVCSYVEVFAVPGSSATHLAMWKRTKLPFVVHAAHFEKGLNLSDVSAVDRNRELLREALLFADELEADTVVVHPGVGGPAEETARQLERAFDPRLCIENKPHFAPSNVVCTGSSPEEIRLIVERVGCRFCLDVGHATCYARSQNLAPLECLKSFLALSPAMFHLADGEVGSLYDRHKHPGAGDFDLRAILAMLPQERRITVETEKDSPDNLDDFVRDIEALRRLENPDVAVRVRAAGASDEERVFQWRNLPSIVAVSTNRRPVALEDHQRWFRATLASEARRLFVVEVDGAPVGTIRYDVLAHDCAEISIYLVPGYVGAGVGPKAFSQSLELIRKWKNLARIIAHVRTDNPRSLKYFQKLGFLRIEAECTPELHVLALALP